MNGYITPTGELIDVEKWRDENGYWGSAHYAYCYAHNTDDEVLLNQGYVKLTECVKPYIFYGRHLTPEQVAKLRELNVSPEEDDLP